MEIYWNCVHKKNVYRNLYVQCCAMYPNTLLSYLGKSNLD